MSDPSMATRRSPRLTYGPSASSLRPNGGPRDSRMAAENGHDLDATRRANSAQQKSSFAFTPLIINDDSQHYPNAYIYSNFTNVKASK